LDYITVKPYLTVKNFIIFAAVATIMLITNNSAAASIGALMAFAALYASYPFVICEKSNMDVLYTTLSIKRNTVVLGRYLFALTLDVFAGLFAFIFSFVVMTAMQNGFDVIDSLSTILIIFLVFTVIQAVQIPIYFKLSYTKAKFLAFLPFIVLPLAILAGSKLFSDAFSFEKLTGLFERFAAAPLTTALIGGVIWLAIMFASYKMSVSVYKKREF
jgi:hypothetical protein